VGAARDYEMPLGKKRIKNFKAKVVDEIWPLLDSIAKEKSHEIVRDDAYKPDEYNEIPLDKYLKAAIEQYATYNAIKASREEAVRLAKEAKAALKTRMHEAKEEYNAIPPRVEGHTPHYSSLTLHSAPYSEDGEDEDIDNDEDEDEEDDDNVAPNAAVRKPSDTLSLSYHTKKHTKKRAKKPPAASDANLSKSPFEDLDHYQEKILSSMKRMKEELFSDVGDDIEEKKWEKCLKMLYVSEDHHCRMGDVQRAEKPLKNMKSNIRMANSSAHLIKSKLSYLPVHL
jgi:hypothetical protein